MAFESFTKAKSVPGKSSAASKGKVQGQLNDKHGSSKVQGSAGGGSKTGAGVDYVGPGARKDDGGKLNAGSGRAGQSSGGPLFRANDGGKLNDISSGRAAASSGKTAGPLGRESDGGKINGSVGAMKRRLGSQYNV